MPLLPPRAADQVVLSGRGGTTSSNSTASPLSIAPTQTWIGNDGTWSPVTIGVGTPPQYVELLVSTTSVQPWVVLDQACGDPSNITTPCAQSRGGLFSKNASTTWENSGLFKLEFEENLGMFASGNFGFDTVTLGLSGSSGGNVVVKNQTVAGIVNKGFWIATWGIRPDYTNLTDLNHRVPSVMASMKDTGVIPSLSWGYTAGAYYRSAFTTAATVSLTFGGSDSSRYQQQNKTIPMSPDPSRDLLVGLRSISSNITNTTLLPTPVLTFLDAGVPHIWLPQDACQVFENAFNLTYNDTLGLYLVNDTTHEALLEQNPSITFSIGGDLQSSDAPINITLPYSSFDLQLTSDFPGVSTPTRYFPLRQAANDSQYTLGRTFFQEAYVIADYERRQFSVHQAAFPPRVNQSLVSIPPAAAQSSASSSSGVSSSLPMLSTAAAAGIAVAVIVSLFASLGLFFWLRKRKAFSRQHSKNMDDKASASELDESATILEAEGSRSFPDELHSDEKKLELDSFSCARHELPTGVAVASELETPFSKTIRAISIAGVFELPGSEYTTDTAQDHSTQKTAVTTDVQAITNDEDLNKELNVSGEAFRTSRSVSEAASFADDEATEVVSLPSPSILARSGSVSSIEEDTDTNLFETAHPCSPISFEQRDHPVTSSPCREHSSPQQTSPFSLVSAVSVGPNIGNRNGGNRPIRGLHVVSSSEPRLEDIVSPL